MKKKNQGVYIIQNKSTIDKVVNALARKTPESVHHEIFYHTAEAHWTIMPNKRRRSNGKTPDFVFVNLVLQLFDFCGHVRQRKVHIVTTIGEIRQRKGFAIGLVGRFARFWCV